MAYEAEEIRTSQEIFYYLLEHHELREEDDQLLYKAYTEEESIRNLVKSQGEIAGSNVERYGNVIYLIPKEENNFLGFSKQQLKGTLCKSGATDKDYYLSQFVILTLLVEFFDGQGSSSKSREYMRVGELMNCLSARLKEGAAEETTTEEEEDGKNPKDTAGISFKILYETYEALKSDDRGSRMKTTKEGFIYNILMFLQKQGLIEYVVQDEMIKTTRKLDNFMDWNLLNQGSSSKSREYMRVGELMNCLSARLKEGAAEETTTEEEEDGKNPKDTAGISFKILYETYEALKSDDRGSRMKTTKEGFIYNILMFLQKQGLIEYVVQDEMIKTTRKLDNFMDWNLLNQNNYQRVLRVLGVAKDE